MVNLCAIAQPSVKTDRITKLIIYVSFSIILVKYFCVFKNSH